MGGVLETLELYYNFVCLDLPWYSILLIMTQRYSKRENMDFLCGYKYMLLHTIPAGQVLRTPHSTCRAKFQRYENESEKLKQVLNKYIISIFFTLIKIQLFDHRFS